MAYIGRSINYGNAGTDSFVGNGTTTYALTYETLTNGVIVTLNGVVKKNGADFEITGTSLVFTTLVANPIVIQVIYLGLSVSFGTPIAGTVTSSTVDSTFLATILNSNVVSSPEVYGFDVDANGHLLLTTTNSGVDSISESTYSGFNDVIFASSGLTWSLVGTQLRCTI